MTPSASARPGDAALQRRPVLLGQRAVGSQSQGSGNLSGIRVSRRPLARARLEPRVKGQSAKGAVGKLNSVYNVTAGSAVGRAACRGGSISSSSLQAWSASRPAPPPSSAGDQSSQLGSASCRLKQFANKSSARALPAGNDSPDGAWRLARQRGLQPRIPVWCAPSSGAGKPGADGRPCPVALSPQPGTITARRFAGHAGRRGAAEGVRKGLHEVIDRSDHRTAVSVAAHDHPRRNRHLPAATAAPPQASAGNAGLSGWLGDPGRRMGVLSPAPPPFSTLFPFFPPRRP